MSAKLTKKSRITENQDFFMIYYENLLPLHTILHYADLADFSHAGNVLFPPWEQNILKVGTNN